MDKAFDGGATKIMNVSIRLILDFWCSFMIVSESCALVLFVVGGKSHGDRYESCSEFSFKTTWYNEMTGCWWISGWVTQILALGIHSSWIWSLSRAPLAHFITFTTHHSPLHHIQQNIKHKHHHQAKQMKAQIWMLWEIDHHIIIILLVNNFN